MIKPSMRSFAHSILVAATLFSQQTFAADFSGTWRYEKGLEYFGQMNVPVTTFPVIQIVNNRAAFSSNCFVALGKARYVYSGPFQSLLKEGVDESKLEKYLNKNFSFSITGNKDYVEADVDANCNGTMRDFLLKGDKLLVPFAGSAFYSYVRTDGGVSRPVHTAIAIGGFKLSQLPFSPDNYINLCHEIIPRVKGVPQRTEKCAPVYYPYVANQKDANLLTKLVGSHDYKKGGASHADDYSPPFASKLQPTFVILPPLKDVLVVRVDDLQGGNEQRDVMSGVYLVIKDGKVSDQINEGCTIDDSYACIGDNGKKLFQLSGSGKFKKPQR